MAVECGPHDLEFCSRVGKFHVDWPRSIGYFGGIAVALALELVAPELALFAALIPVLKLFKRRDSTRSERWVLAVLSGAAKPLGGDAEATIHAAPDTLPFWEDRGAPATH